MNSLDRGAGCVRRQPGSRRPHSTALTTFAVPSLCATAAGSGALPGPPPWPERPVGSAELVSVGGSVGIVEPSVQLVDPTGGGATEPPVYYTLHLVRGTGRRLLAGHYLRSLGKLISVPTLAATSTPAAGGLWAYGQGRLQLLDPATGAATRSVRSPLAVVDGLVVTPDGKSLYVTGTAGSGAELRWVVDRVAGRALRHRMCLA